MGVFVDGGEPETQRGSVVPARSASVALDERIDTELFQTRSGGGEELSGTFGSGAVVHKETPSSPQSVPTVRTCRYESVLRVDSQNVGGCLTDDTS